MLIQAAAKQIVEAVESFGREELATHGGGYQAIFRMRNAEFIFPDALQVGIRR